jgi:GDPmannose 4,6-dehydratase
MYAIQGWLFNHEGTRRGEEFVTRKITKGVVHIAREMHHGKEIIPLELGNVDAKRDWSDAEDCVVAVWKMLNQDVYNSSIEWMDIEGHKQGYSEESVLKDIAAAVKEYVVSSGENHTVREFVEEAFNIAGIEGTWVGKGIDEKFLWGKDEPSDVLVKINPTYYRPAEVDALLGNSSKIKKELGWTPTTTFKQLVKKMVENDMK